MSVSLKNLTRFCVDEESVLTVLQKILKEEEKKEEVSVVFVGSKKIKELNRTYRGKDCVTDVLSFVFDEKNFLGEVFVCPAKVKKDFQKEDFTKEFFRVIIHGVLHLCGYRHDTTESEKKMNERTEYYLNTVGA
ncbi:MAG: rRNA maturation RNase YbeY [Candidatus Pacebacteria bacterium]|nr:rRNA maturation RNase YbeY [Candidatus Paceibacterota bacterium]